MKNRNISEVSTSLIMRKRRGILVVTYCCVLTCERDTCPIREIGLTPHYFIPQLNCEYLLLNYFLLFVKINLSNSRGCSNSLVTENSQRQEGQFVLEDCWCKLTLFSRTYTKQELLTHSPIGNANWVPNQSNYILTICTANIPPA